MHMNDVIVVEQSNPMQMLAAAVAKGVDTEQLKSLMDLQERWERNEARKAFVSAMNAFKANPPEIVKNKLVSFQTAKGKTEYKHALSGAASEQIGAALAEHGISHRWEVEQLEGGKIRVTCILTHALGHSERVSLSASPDDSGGKNSIQAIGSAVSYLQRYTLFAANGLVPKDADDDATGGTKAAEMDERVRNGFLDQIQRVPDRKSAESLWQTIASECTKLGDIPSYNSLKAAVAARVKTLEAAK
jgi:hypothetical protein